MKIIRKMLKKLSLGTKNDFSKELYNELFDQENSFGMSNNEEIDLTKMSIETFLEKYDKELLTEEEKKEVFLLNFQDCSKIQVFSKKRRVFKTVKIKDRYFFLGYKAEDIGEAFDPFLFEKEDKIHIKEIKEQKEIDNIKTMRIIG